MRAGAVMLLVLLAAPQAADAEVTWRAPDGCPDAGRFATMVAAHGGDVAAVDADVAVEQPNGGGWRVRVSFADTSERTVDGASCEEVAAAAALVIALATPEPAPPTAEPSPLPPTPVTPPAPPPVRKSRHSPWTLRLDAGVGVGARPSTGVLAGASLALARAAWRAELGASWQTPAETGTLSLTLLAGRARGCAGVRAGFHGCVGAEIGWLRADSHEMTDSRLWLAPVLALGWSRNLSEVLLIFVEAESAFPWERPIYIYDGATVHHVAPVDARLLLGIGARL